VSRALDALEARAEQDPDAVIDLKAEYAHPVASQVIGELLGVRPADQDGILARAGYVPATPQEMAAAFLRIRQDDLSADVGDLGGRLPGRDVARHAGRGRPGTRAPAGRPRRGERRVRLAGRAVRAGHLLTRPGWPPTPDRPGARAPGRSGAVPVLPRYRLSPAGPRRSCACRCRPAGVPARPRS
jgi:hypothetical protein